jgi:hypothetical protein
MITDLEDCEDGAQAVVYDSNWVWPSYDKNYAYDGRACVYFHSSGAWSSGDYDGSIYFNPNWPTVTAVGLAYNAPICQSKNATEPMLCMG